MLGTLLIPILTNGVTPKMGNGQQKAPLIADDSVAGRMKFWQRSRSGSKKKNCQTSNIATLR